VSGFISCSLSQFHARASCLDRIPAQNDENRTDLQVGREYRADTTANGTSTTVTYGTTGSGIGAKGITITKATGETANITVTTKTAIKI
jgi:hypothetical protein